MNLWLTFDWWNYDYLIGHQKHGYSCFFVASNQESYNDVEAELLNATYCFL